MKTKNLAHLDHRLREKIPTETPRPGFETRIQAMAREPYIPEKKSLIRRIAMPVLAVLAIGIVISPKDNPAKDPAVVQPAPIEPPAKEPNLVKIKEPVEKEIKGLKNDAEWTMSLFKKALPSIPPSRKEEEDTE